MLKDAFNKNIYDFSSVRESVRVNTLKQAVQDAGKMLPLDNTYAAELTDFLLATHSGIGNIVTSIRSNDTFINQLSSQLKIVPKKESTTSLAEQLLSIASLNNTDMFIKLGNYAFDKRGNFDNNHIKSCITMMIDNDESPEIYNMPENKRTTYIINKYPFFRVCPPTMIITSGGKGFHALYVFSSDIIDNKGIYEFVNRQLILLCGGDTTKSSMGNAVRMPFSYNTKTNRRVEIISYGNKYSYKDFVNRVIKNAKNTFINFEGMMFSEEDLCKDMEIDHLDHNTQKYLQDEGIIVSDIYTYITRRYDYKINDTSKDSNDFSKIVIREKSLQYDNVGKKPKDTLKYRAKLQTKKKHISTSLSAEQEAFLLRRKFDLERYLDINKGDIVGHRSAFILFMANTLRRLSFSKDACEKALNVYNNKFTEPLKSCEVQAVFRYVYRKRLFLSNIKMADMLGIKDSKEYNLANWYDEEGKLLKLKQRNRFIAATRKKKRGVNQKRMIKIMRLMNALKNVDNSTCDKVGRAAKKAGISRSYAYKLLSRYKALQRVMKNKVVHRKRAIERFLKHHTNWGNIKINNIVSTYMHKPYFFMLQSLQFDTLI